MNKLAILIATGLIAAPIPASAQTGNTAPAKPKSSTAQKSTAAKSYDRALLHPALLKDKAPETYQVKFETSKGDFTVSVTRSWAPQGADRFYNLAEHHFFDNESFFRVLKSFIAQFGISAYPALNAVWQKATIQDDPVTQSNKKYFLTFASTPGPNSRATQLFINLGDNPRLDGMGFAPFGQVTEGMNVVDTLYTDYGEGPPTGSGPDQDKIQEQGKPYLDKNFPNLDFIKTTTLTPAPSPATHRTLPAKKTVSAPKP
jgi:peptidyl-prolyl cis-trans isomerase A (cyclophilin A)